LRAAFAGTPEFALPAFAALRAHHQVVGVLTQPDRPSGRGRRLSASAVKNAALAAHLPLAQPPTLTDAAACAVLEGWQADVLVVVAYGLLLPRTILALPRYGCLNIHASLLPRWRGAAPVQRAILAGDRETGVSIMQMDAGLDTGPVLLEQRIAIRPNHTGGSLHAALAALGADALLRALDGLAAGTLRARPQPQEGATYAGKITKTEARIDWTRTSDEIERQVRAFNPSPMAETRLEGEQLRVLAARAVPVGATDQGDLGTKGSERVAKIHEPGSIIAVNPESVTVQCGQGWLAITEVQRPGKRPVSAADYSRSLSLVGRRLG
jgi:methionyl-tRNA formyltransferase